MFGNLLTLANRFFPVWVLMALMRIHAFLLRNRRIYYQKEDGTLVPFDQRLSVPLGFGRITLIPLSRTFMMDDSLIERRLATIKIKGKEVTVGYDYFLYLLKESFDIKPTEGRINKQVCYNPRIQKWYWKAARNKFVILENKP